ncbi:uncharacterized protein LOC127750780 [Frankliniella occidentalis]|uniref:Uncharacterized protein LOC127750780 n=1 Tax=Frankliniella occidentalis TaxID=133901 RepID=A0A9C6X4Y6_FRAOC|nr:uncharacterized protein LOC127750780 [Frankliniella occidentalis]
MPLEQRSSPLFVLVVFVNLIRLSYSCGRPCESVADYEATPVAKIWKYEQETEVSCSFCGGDEQKKFKCVLELKDQSIRDLQSSVESELFNTKEEVCPLCSENEATINLRVVDMPKCLLVHLEKCTLLSPLPFELDIRGTKLSLKCIIVEPKGVRTGCYIITRCHDHRFRRFNDTQITVASPTRLSMENFYTNSNVTLMYESKVDEQWGNQVSTDHIMAVKGDNKIQIQPHPDESPVRHAESLNDEGDQEGRDHLARTCDAEVQTEQKCVVDRGVQTLPYYSFETCRYNPKFKFFTGLDVEEFLTLYELIGGDDTISTLKRKYTGRTPDSKKKRQQKLSSEDKLFMFLLRLRRGFTLEDIAEMFNIGHTLAEDICYIMTRHLYLSFKAMENEMFPTAAQQRK